MQYICLIYAQEGAEPDPGTPEFAAFMQGYGDFTERVQREKKFISGEQLQPIATATTVSVRNGKTETIDGPFAETKEQLGGYYVLDCVDLDEALQYAAMIPSSEHGRVEVRPVVVFEN